MSGIDDFKHLSDREVLITAVLKIDDLVEKVKGHDADIASLKDSRKEVSLFFKVGAWLLGLPGVLALILAGRDKM